MYSLLDRALKYVVRTGALQVTAPDGSQHSYGDGSGQPVSVDSVNFVRVDVLNDKTEIDGFANVARFAAVPEPSTLALALLGAAGILFARRRKA